MHFSSLIITPESGNMLSGLIKSDEKSVTRNEHSWSKVVSVSVLINLRKSEMEHATQFVLPPPPLLEMYVK